MPPGIQAACLKTSQVARNVPVRSSSRPAVRARSAFAAAACEDPLRDPPCRVTVRLSYEFHLFTPVGIALPPTLTFQRDSTFAMTDIGLTPTPGP